MGRIGKWLKSEAEKFVIGTVETRFKFNQTCDFYTESGSDCPPLENDRVALLEVDGTGNFVAVGVLQQSQGAKPGEKFLYSRNDKGEIQACIKLLEDGKIETYAPEEVTFTADKKIIVNVKEDVEFTSKKKIDIKGKDIKLEGNVKITGGELEAKGTATPTGQGCLCAMPFCAFTGAPQTGSKSTGN